MKDARNMINDTAIPEKRRGIAVMMAIVVVFAIFAYFWRLGSFAVTDTDEATHAMVTRSIVEDGNILTLQLLGKDYFRKPPLAFWLRAGAMMVFGQTEFALRFFSAVAGVGTALVITLWAWQFTRRKPAALLAGLLFPLFPITHIHTFRHGDTDGVLIFLLTLSAYFLWRSLQRPSHLYWAAVVLGLATMTKSAAMLVLPAAFVATLIVTRSWPYRLKHILVALGLFVVVTAPWHIYEVARNGGGFVQDYLGYHIVDRTISPITASSHDRGPLWYLKAGEKGMYPWSWLVIPAAALALTRFRRKREETQTQTFLLVWSFGTVLLYSLAVTKLDWYIAAAYPAFALLIAQYVAALLSSTQPPWLHWLSLLTLAGLFLRALQLFHGGVLTAFPFAHAGWRLA
ncbi:MAG: glycosyltransferase family 39 protein, partial [Candidatus Kerfeldbacteria bacterium]|nr:glycosyltransferase family 39 protein [Candidatus Kerfeldbacteria bacterium]